MSEGVSVPPGHIVCPECSEPTYAWGRGGSKQFCSPKCRMAFHARAKVEGAAIIALAKVWRRNRGSGETAREAFAEMVRILDSFTTADIAAGRPNPTDYVKRLLSSGYRYMDRR